MTNGKSFIAENVIIATGVNRVLYAPVWKGQEDYKESIVHSRDYKNTIPFKE